MFPTGILFVVLVSSTGAIATSEIKFDSIEKCEAARTVILKNNHYTNMQDYTARAVFVECFK